MSLAKAPQEGRTPLADRSEDSPALAELGGAPPNDFVDSVIDGPEEATAAILLRIGARGIHPAHHIGPVGNIRPVVGRIAVARGDAPAPQDPASCAAIVEMRPNVFPVLTGFYASPRSVSSIFAARNNWRSAAQMLAWMQDSHHLTTRMAPSLPLAYRGDGSVRSDTPKTTVIYDGD